MYISACQSTNWKEVIVWERGQNGREQRRFPTPYYFYIRDEDGEHRDIHGNSLKKLTFDNHFDCKNAIAHYRNRGEKLYESDISAEYKILASHYYGTETPNTNITFFDIEVDYDKTRGFSTVEDPYAPISAISLHHYWLNKDIVFVVPPPNRKDVTVEELNLSSDYPDAVIILCENEKQLLKLFYEEIEDSDILSGWNSATFDIPYIYERAKMVFSENFANKLSFPDARNPRYREFKDKNNLPQRALDLFGRESVDYLDIYRKFEVVEKPSYSLENISEEVLPDLPKLEYEGSLYDLYRDDFEHFIRYNIRDSEVLKGFEDKLGYMRVAIKLSHSSCGVLRDVTGTLKMSELAIINFCHNELHTIVPDSVHTDELTEKFKGALVLFPIVGMHENVAAIDVVSLYPRAIMTVNASPETLVGQFFDKHEAHQDIALSSEKSLFFKFENGDMEERPASAWREYLREHNYSVSGYGTVFSMEKQGFIPAIISEWFKQRKLYKKQAYTASMAMEGLTVGSAEYIKAKNDYDYADRLQYIFKIRLNSLYGALGNRFFKFFDVRLAESTTRSGQAILMHMVRKVAETIDGTYAYPSESAIYSDTDSSYFLTHGANIDEAIEVGKTVATIVNASFPGFVKDSFLCSDDYANYIEAELDVVASKSIFIKKKYYIMQLAYSDKKPSTKLKIMGVSLKKTTLPKPISKQLTIFIKELLNDRNWRMTSEDIVKYRDWIIEEASVSLIGLPKGIKDFNSKEEEYNNGNKEVTLSGHASAALFYNLCLKEYGDVESFRIRSGMKIKTYYLTKTFGRFKSIALPSDLKIIPPWFQEHFVPLIDREAQTFRLINKPLQSILDAINERVPSYTSLLYDDLMVY